MAFEEKTRVEPAREQAPAPDVVRQMLETLVQETIRAEFERFLGAAPYERTPTRRGHRNGSYARTVTVLNDYP
jgi:transposase-like protein